MLLFGIEIGLFSQDFLYQREDAQNPEDLLELDKNSTLTLTFYRF